MRFQFARKVGIEPRLQSGNGFIDGLLFIPKQRIDLAREKRIS
jgi:hypothetical protein